MRYVVIFCFFATFGCKTDGFYKGIEDLKDGVWPEKYEAKFQFDITDTLKTYDLYYHIRNTPSYPYYNLYISRELQYPDGSKEVAIKNELILFDEKTGLPLGNGLGDLWDHKIKIANKVRFKKLGKHTVTLKQFMRQDPLPFVLSVGLSLEPIAK
jgi:gliding motility-associated lipoprotein GldH